MGGRGEIDAHAARIRDSVGEPVYEDEPSGRESWIDLQAAAVGLAEGAADEGRSTLARVLLDAIVHQGSFGPGNRLSPEAFALVLDAAPDELAASLAPGVGHTYGGRRYLRSHVWSLRESEGARWLGVLGRADPGGSLPPAEIVASWTADEWSERLDVVAGLPVEPRPALVALPALAPPPRGAMPAVVRVVLVHAVDDLDQLVRFVADQLRAHRTSPEASVDLFDWEAGQARPELLLRLLELSADEGTRPVLVAAAVRAGAITEDDAAPLAAPFERPAWADGEVAWALDEVVDVGEARLPAGRLTGGDPWCTGGPEGFPWTIDVPAGSYRVRIAIASHPLEGRDCAALELLLDGDAAVESWSLVRTGGPEDDGYRVEVGAASLGAPAAYGTMPLPDDLFERTLPAYEIVGGGADGTIVLCSVRPQHQLCRTWVGTTAGRPVAVVTDLGLLALDLDRTPSLAWR